VLLAGDKFSAGWLAFTLRTRNAPEREMDEQSASQRLARETGINEDIRGRIFDAHHAKMQLY
jgi:hypothetical protein